MAISMVVINIVQPNYYDNVIDTPEFIPACIAVGVMLTINVIFMKIMVNIKV